MQLAENINDFGRLFNQVGSIVVKFWSLKVVHCMFAY